MQRAVPRLASPRLALPYRVTKAYIKVIIKIIL